MEKKAERKARLRRTHTHSSALSFIYIRREQKKGYII